MRVAYFTDSLPPITDGVARTLTQLADTLLAERVDFRFFTSVEPPAELPWHDRAHKIGSFAFPPYPYYRIGVPLSFVLDPLVDGFAPDLVHVVSPTLLGLFGIKYAQSRRLPVVGSFHTHFVSYFRFYGVGGMEALGWRYLAWFYNQCAKTYVPSPTMAAELRAHNISAVELWERGIDTTRYSPRHRSGELRAQVDAMERPLMLFVGRLVREKNLATLAHAAALLEQHGARFKLVLVGDGPMRAELEQQLPNAVFAGVQTGAELARWYASADLFVFPSTTETFGNVILEAFASGLPVVGADKGGVRDLVQTGVNGLLAAADSADDLARQLGQLLSDPALVSRLANGALQTASRYRWPQVNGRLLQSYARVVAAHRPVARSA